MEICGLDINSLEDQRLPVYNYPEQVSGRELHIDADFLAYQVSADDTKTLSDMEHNCDVIVDRLKNAAGAEYATLHLTPLGSNKGNRHNIALLKEYQGNRKGKIKPRFLHVIREWMHKERGAILHAYCEADDGMAIAQYRAIREGNRDLSVIVSRDKDLAMVPGLALNWDTHEITDTGSKPFGWITLDREKSQPRIKGRGTHLFWVQMLQGDTADNISGLPKIVTDDKIKSCGPVAAYELLKDCKSDMECAQIVLELYHRYDEEPTLGFYNYRDGSEITAEQAFWSEAKLLWMRRVITEDDVLSWYAETVRGRFT